jgi:hypothetical protein
MTLNKIEQDSNMLVNSDLHDIYLLNEKLDVNKMLFVLIFLMVK